MLIVALLFSGCSITLSVDELMRPPSLTAEQEDIYKALMEHTGNSGIKLKYPRSGEHRSAFIKYDIDFDNEQETIVFYDNTPTGINAEASVCVNILDDVDGKWQSIAEYQYSCSDIDIIDFVHNKDGAVSIAIGYVTGLSQKVLDVYEYEEKKLNLVYQINYTKLYVCDADSDGIDEMMVFNNNYAGHTSNVQVVEPDKDFEITAVVEMQPDISEISNITSAVTEDGFILYIDEIKVSNMMNTEVLKFLDGKVENLTYAPENEKVVETLRTNGIYSDDIDLDAKIEIPCASVFLGYEAVEKDKQENAIQWLVLNDDELSRKYYSYYNITDGYMFLFPERWVGRVTVRIDSRTDEAVFVKYEGDNIYVMKELMRIKSMPKGIELPKEFENYQSISQDSENDFYVKLSSDEQEPLVLTSTEASYGLYPIKK